MRLTVNRILALKPCEPYDRARLEALFAGRKTASIAKALACSEVPVEDRVWLGIALLPGDRERRLFACWCAERVLPVWEKIYPEDKRPRAAIEVARRYAEGKATEEESEAAYSAADAAAYAVAAYYDAASVADAAAYAAAAYYDAAVSAAAASADAAAADAAAADAAAADADDAASAERKAQLEHLCELLAHRKRSGDEV